MFHLFIGLVFENGYLFYLNKLVGAFAYNEVTFICLNNDVESVGSEYGFCFFYFFAGGRGYSF